MISYVNVHAILEGRRSRAKASSSNDYDSSQVFFPFLIFHHKHTKTYLAILHAYAFSYQFCAHKPLFFSMLDIWNFLNFLLSSSRETQGEKNQQNETEKKLSLKKEYHGRVLYPIILVQFLWTILFFIGIFMDHFSFLLHFTQISIHYLINTNLPIFQTWHLLVYQYNT